MDIEAPISTETRSQILNNYVAVCKHNKGKPYALNLLISLQTLRSMDPSVTISLITP